MSEDVREEDTLYYKTVVYGVSIENGIGRKKLKNLKTLNIKTKPT